MDNTVKCRTCMEFCGDRFRRITSYVGQFKPTCKDIIIHLIPEMDNRLKDDVDVICFNCYKTISSCVRFIQKGLQVEIDLRSKEEIILANNCNVESSNKELDSVQENEVNETVTYEIKENTSDDKCLVKKPIEFDELSQLPDDVLRHNRIISVKQPNTDVIHNFLGCLVSSGIRVLHCSFKPEQNTLKKRILFIGMDGRTEIFRCKECGHNPRSEKAAERHALHHKRLKERKELRRKMCLQKKEERHAAELAAQLKEEELKRNGFKCERCREYFITKEELNAHLKTHTPYTCDQCDKSFPLKRSLKAHKNCHNPKDSYICSVCGRGFSLNSTLRQHMFTHEKRLVLCTQCPKIFGQEFSLRKHMRRAHGKSNPVQCKKCGKMIKTASLLSTHYKLMHIREAKFNCELCGEKFVRKDYLKRHINRHSGFSRRIYSKPGNAKAMKQFKCNVCGKIFKKIENLKTHLFVHSSLKPYRCKICGLSFTTPTGKWRHEKLHTKNINISHKCPVCWRICENEEYLSQHVSKHPTPYKCDFCELAFGRKYLLTHHISETHVVAENESLYYKSMLEKSLKQSEVNDELSPEEK